MHAMTAALTYLLFAWIAVTGVLFLLVIYGNTMSLKEDDPVYASSSEQAMAASPQQTLIERLNRLAQVITVLAACSAILLCATVGVWAWIGIRG